MKSCVAAALVLLLLLFGAPWLTAEAPEKEVEDSQQQEDRADETVLLRVWDGSAVQEMSMAEYLPGVVRGEMPASFEMEALKAQAVAERTYIYYKRNTGGKAAHPDADVCMQPSCCSAYTSAQAAVEKWGDKADEYEARIQTAVTETDGQVLLYHDQPILAAFHSSSAGVTANSGDVWVSDLPYLASVTSPESGESVPNYYSVKTLTAEEFRQTFTAAYPEAQFSDDTATWITGATHNASDRVETVTVGGVTVEGTEMRTIFGLRSASFTTETTAETVTFRVTGYGHGVGMSQYGANEMAKQGKTWQDILRWYYTGVTIADYTP